MRIEIQVLGEDAIARDLLRFGDRAADPLPAFAKIREDFSVDMAEIFATEGGASSGGAWPELADTTRDAKQRQGLDPRILHATLALRDSLVNPESSDAKTVMTTTLLELGSELDYGKYHMTGTANMPKRAPLPSELMRRGYVKTLQRWVVEGLLA